MKQKIVFLSLLFSLHVLSASSVDFHDIDPKKSIIQLASYSNHESIDEDIKKINPKKDIYIRKLPNYTILYAVNIPKNSKYEELQKFQAMFKDAYISSKSYALIKEGYEKNTFTNSKKPPLGPVRLKKRILVKKQQGPIKIKQTKILDPTKTKIYKRALRNFTNQNYQKSFDLLNKLSKKYPQNEMINYYIGRSAFELDNYEIAFAAYDRVLIQNPVNHKARLEYARSLYMMKSYKEAKEEVEKVLSSPIPKNVRKNVEKFLVLLDDKMKNYVFNKVAIFGFGWDDNIDNGTDEYTNNLTNLANTNTEKKKDQNYKVILIGNLIVPIKSNERLASESTLVTYWKKQKKYNASNIFLTSLSSGISYKDQNYKNLTSFNFDHVWVGGAKTLYTYGLSNNIKIPLLEKHLLSLDLKYKKKQYINISDYDKNSNIKELGVNYTYFLENKKDKINLSSTYNQTRKTQGDLTDISKNNNKYKFYYQKFFPYDYDLKISYQFEKIKYKETSAGIIRKDDKKDITLKLSKKLDKKQVVSAEVSKVDRDSNNNLYQYEKNMVNINYMVLF